MPLRLPRRSKYHAKPCWIKGIRFASQREGKRFLDLRLLERAGEIADLELQPRYELHTLSPIGEVVTVGKYTADFRYRRVADGQRVVEDSKSPASKTEAYQLRKRMVEAEYGIQISEV
jgi:hypothetical protein